jgi:VWFA-related protein
MSTRRIARILILALPLMSAFGAPARGADATPPPPVFSSGVELITVDAVVVDAKGEPVKGLTKDDFVVKEDGQPRDIMSFEPFVFDEPPAPQPQTHAVIASNARPLKDPGRAFGIVIDDSGITATEAAQAVKTVSSFIEKTLRDGDAVLLATTSGDAWWNARLPADRADLLAVVARLKGKFFQVPSASDYMSEYEAFYIDAYESHMIGRVTRRVMDRWLKTGVCATVAGINVSDDTCHAQVEGRASDVDSFRKKRTRLATDTLTRVTEALSPIRGRKSLLFFSRGFVEDPGLQMRDVATTAREANTAIYFLDTRGLVATRADTGDASELAINSAGQSDLTAIGFENGNLDSAGTQALAEETGGFSVRNTSLETGAVRVADESRVFYLLGFYPSEGKKAEQWRKLRVEVKQKGLTVRARRGFSLRNSQLHPEKVDVHAKKASGTVVRALDSPRDLVDIPLRAMSYVQEPRPKEVTHVVVAAELDAQHLTYEDAGKTRVARLEISVIATHRDSPLMLRSDQRVEIRLPQGEAPGWRGVSRELDLPVGVSQVRVAVRDLASGALGSVLQRIVVPPPVGLHISTPVVSDKLDKSGSRPTALLAVHRVFPPEGQIFCQFEVFGATSDKNGGVNVVSAFELMTSDGKVARVAPASAIAPDGTGRLARLSGFSVADLPEGTYDLVLMVKDEVSGDLVERHEPLTLTRQAL